MMKCPFSFRQTQWDPPSWDGTTEEASVEHEAEMDLGTPTYDENPSKVLNYSLCLREHHGIFINLNFEVLYMYYLKSASTLVHPDHL